MVGDDAVDVGSWIQSTKLCLIFNQSCNLCRNQDQRALVKVIKYLTLFVQFLYDKLVGSHAEASHVDFVGVSREVRATVFDVVNELHHAAQAVIPLNNIHKQVFIYKYLAVTTAIVEFNAFVSCKKLLGLLKAHQLLLSHLFDQQMNHALNLSRLNLRFLQVHDGLPEFGGSQMLVVVEIIFFEVALQGRIF